MASEAPSDLPQAAGKAGGERKGKGKGGSRGGASRDVQVSKALSKLLRHDAQKAGLELDEEGFADVGEVLKWNRLKSLNVTFDDIQHAVADNTKQRFALKLNPTIIPAPPASTNPSHYLIRANQGHSIPLSSASLLTPLTLEAGNIPATVVHGTYYAAYPAILKSGGLKPMSRNHVHCSTGLPEDVASGVVSGMRNDAELLVYIDVERSLADGETKWWISDNGVVLTEGDREGLVRPRYWKRVVGRRGGVGVLWEDGREIAELPENVRGRRLPGGKGQRGAGKGKGRGEGNGGIAEVDVGEGVDEGAPVYVETVETHE